MVALSCSKAFLHCSSSAVVRPTYDELRTVGPPRWATTQFLFPTYSISKIAWEVVVRSWRVPSGVPTHHRRLNSPYGDNGGWPFYHMEM